MIYTHRLPLAFGRLSLKPFAFRYPQPVGRVELLLRSISDLFIVNEVFEQTVYSLPPDMKPRTILDLGSHAGYTAVWFKRHYPGCELAVVEPVPDNLRLLRVNLELNNVPARIFPTAAHSSAGTIVMALQAETSAHKALENEAPQKPESKDFLEVECTTVDRLLSALNWDTVDLLKIDIEGHEKTVLGNSQSWIDRVNAIVVEWHYDDAETWLGDFAKRHNFGSPEFTKGVWLLRRR